MRNYALLFCFIFILAAEHQAQTARIKRIVDSNLFETYDGRVIKLAGVDAPNSSHPDRYLKSVAEKAVIYAKSVFLNRHFDVIPVLPADTTKDYMLVFIRKDYPLGQVDYNKEYLSQGFGRFTGKVPVMYYNEYRKAEMEAQDKERGIWKILASGSIVELDRAFGIEEIARFREKDSLLFVRMSAGSRANIAGNIASQLVIAPLAGFAGAYAGGFLFAGFGALAGIKDLGYMYPVLFGAGVGYAAGTALAVYLMAQPNNPNVSYWNTLGYSFIGAGAGIGIASLMNHKGTSFPYVVAFAAPVIASIVYADFLAPSPSFRDYYYFPVSESSGNLSSLSSHKDLYNSTVLCNVDLFRIPF